MTSPRSSAVRGLFALSALGIVLGCSSENTPSSEAIGSKEQALSTGLVISQIYGAGGNATAPYNADYIEIFNRSTDPIDLTGFSVQYASSAGASWSKVDLPAVSVPGGHYFLIGMSPGETGVAVPADVTGSIAMATAAGKVALVNSTTLLTCGATASRCIGSTTPASIIDYVGYGAATDFEGTGPTVAPSTLTSVSRKGAGCIETDDNLLDFELLSTPAPRNSSTPIHACATADAGIDSGDAAEGGASDTGTPDTGLVDTGLVDTGLIDIGLLDTGLVDTAVLDTGEIDTSVLDTGAADAGALDTAILDIGATDTAIDDTAVVDSAIVDTAITDTAIGDGAIADSGTADVGSDASSADVAEAAADAAADSVVTTDSAIADSATSDDTAAGADTGSTLDAATRDSSTFSDTAEVEDTGAAPVTDADFTTEGSGCAMPGTPPHREVDVLALGAGLAGILLMRRRRR